MTQPFVGEIRMVGFNFPPTGWAFCDGRLMLISQNTALFSLLGTFYGGDGKATYALPDLQDRVPIGQGQSSASGYNYFLGETGGELTVTLLTSEIPVHTHQAQAASTSDTILPTTASWGTLSGRTPPPRYSSNNADVSMHPLALNISGGSLPHNNAQPTLAVNFIIALQGVFPPRS